jgi:hypothetical protein
MNNITSGTGSELPRQQFIQDWIWHALSATLCGSDETVDESDETDAAADERFELLKEKIQSDYIVTVVISIERESISGDEHDVVGIANPVGGGGALLFSASDSRDYCGTDDLGIHDHLSVKIANLLIDDRWNLCQISGTTITNHRPDLLCRDDIAAIIERLVVTGGLTWDDVGDEAASTDEFLNQSYREIAS